MNDPGIFLVALVIIGLVVLIWKASAPFRHEISKMFRQETPEKRASKELADAQLELLSALTQQDYYSSVVKYNNDRITRLRQMLESKKPE